MPLNCVPGSPVLGPLHGLINNAGLLINKPFRELSPEDWQAMFAVNVFGVAEMIRALLPVFTNDGGHILNVGSMGGFQGSAKFPGLSAYSASKAALASLTECLAEELKNDKIAVNCLALGAVQTEMLETAFPGFQAPVSSEEMGRLLAWFIRQGHTFFNGKVLPVSVSTP
jgi:NAD(P)-dependent dehydrogenase (short-subunit alcohol dehydrogenase family)